MCVGRAWVTEWKGCIIGRHLDCNYLHPPSISIPLCSRSGGLRCCRGNGFLHEERLYQLTFTRHRRPVFHSFLYPRIYDFPRPVSTRKWRQDLPVATESRRFADICSSHPTRLEMTIIRPDWITITITLLRSPENSSRPRKLFFLQLKEARHLCFFQ